MHVNVEKIDNYAIVSICKEPVNSMDTKLWEDLGTALAALEADSAVHGAIFQSGLKRDVYTAGNDIKELYMPATSKEQFLRFWTAQTMFLVNLYKSPLFTIASIRGACPAGGCILAMCCDYRIQTDDPGAVIGLNEVALGIGVPRYWVDIMASLVGGRRTETLLMTAAMPSSREAQQIGLIDQVVSKDDLLPASQKVMAQCLKFPRAGQILTKLAIRGDLAKKWGAYCPEEAETVYNFLSAPAVVSSLEGVLKRLAGGKKKQSKL
ncbi:hypothetical protein CYMTET_41166 [Cymbomonas tetramitiformis]|uniref:Uncharacterized protein n=1 Tax=Cymbomonas tetramitiformis TaxID=36881 RepID=A0AAE0C6P0_9CHLO|nr:hypothetical protein CYMTET_41166 [Cymbomonas tetramitiformis]